MVKAAHVMEVKEAEEKGAWPQILHKYCILQDQAQGPTSSNWVHPLEGFTTLNSATS